MMLYKFLHVVTSQREFINEKLGIPLFYRFQGEEAKVPTVCYENEN